MAKEEIEVKGHKYTCDLCGNEMILTENQNVYTYGWLAFTPKRYNKSIVKYVCDSCKDMIRDK